MPTQKGGPRINEDIRIASVHLIDKDGVNLGNVPTAEALAKAQEAGLDLVEISPNASPPICKILDYGKYKYQEQKKAAEARKKQKVVEVKEIKYRPMIDDHDFDTKTARIREFLEHGNKVRVTVMFRRRDMRRPENGLKLLGRVAEALADVGKPEHIPTDVVSRDLTMTIMPLRQPVKLEKRAPWSVSSSTRW